MDASAVGEQLAAERNAILARVHALTFDLEGIVAASIDSNIDDEHDPEGATVAFERAQVSALLREAQTSLEDLDHALARLAAGTYGLCERCGAPIVPERLAARPATRTCIGCALSAPST